MVLEEWFPNTGVECLYQSVQMVAPEADLPGRRRVGGGVTRPGFAEIYLMVVLLFVALL